MTQIDELNAENASLVEKIDRYRNRKTCSACGTANEETASYCKNCGEAI
jgi:transposase